MTCTICHTPLEDHGESRETDRCVAEKLGYVVMGENEGYKDVYYLDDYVGNKDICLLVPHYSSKDMSKETWELTGKLKEDDWSFYPENGGWVLFHDIDKENPIKLVAETPTLAIIRAFLGMEK